MERRKLAHFNGRIGQRRLGKPRGTTMVVYGLVDPRDGEVKYIGITNNLLARFREHMGMHGGNTRKQAWLQEVMDAHMLPYMVTLEVVKEDDSARERESLWIQAYVDAGKVLLNDEVAKKLEVEPLPDDAAQENREVGTMRHRKLVPMVTCEHCGRAMYHLHSTTTQMVYGCTNGHIRKIARPNGQRVSIQWNNGPDTAA